MTIGAISFQPYVYNVNAISPASMNRLSRISDDVLDKKTDYSGLTKAENENPLMKGQTLNFQDMLEMQMQRGRSNAARVMKPAEEESFAQEKPAEQAQLNMAQQEETAQTAPVMQMTRTATQPEETAAAAPGTENSAQSGVGSFRMQQAINAYQMFMTA